VISKDNYENLEQIILQGKQLGVDKIRFEHLIFLTSREYDSHIKACNGFLTPKQAQMTTYLEEINDPEIGRFLSKEFKRLKRKYGNFVAFKPYMSDQERKQWYVEGFDFNRKCLFVDHSLFIKPNGDIVPCQFFLEYVLGNIQTDEVFRIWRSAKRKHFVNRLKQKILPGCKRCCKL
jgi:MoaA/NifB/PqqE/SkfB family radical SAM enzyme